jgi:hypothetical protein
MGQHGDGLTRWTEEYQESIYEHQIGMLKKIPFLRGTAPWILMDFRSPRRPFPAFRTTGTAKASSQTVARRRSVLRLAAVVWIPESALPRDSR